KRETMTPNQAQVINRPLQVRCSSQPIGLRSSFRRIQRRKKSSQMTGVQNVFSNQRCRAEGGSSCQTRAVFAPAARAAKAKASKEPRPIFKEIKTSPEEPRPRIPNKDRRPSIGL